MEILGKELRFMKAEKIGKFEAICLMIIIIVNAIVLNIPNIIVLSTGSSAIINVIYVGAIAIAFSVILFKLFDKFSGKDILDVSEYVGGKILKLIVGTAFLVFFLILSIVAVRYLSSSIKIIYFNNSPFVYILLFFIVPAVAVNKLGLKTVACVNVVLIFIVIVSLLFLFISSYKNFTISKMFPIFGNGLNETFLIGSTNIIAFTNLAFLFLLPSLLKKTTDFKEVSIYSIIVSATILVFSIATLILTLPIVTESDEMLSIYLLTRMVEFGNFLERLDAFFIFAWIITLLSSLSISIFYIIRFCSKMFNLQDEKVLASPIGLIILGGCLLIKNYSQIKFLGVYIYRYGFIGLVFVIGLGILVLANLKLKRKVKL